MKRIINQKRYDTNTAKELGTWSSMDNVRDFYYFKETLYQKKTGEFFLHGEGNAASKYAEPEGMNSWSGGERLMPLSYRQAQKWAEEHLDADEYEKIFGEIDESGHRVIVTFSLPTDVVEKLKRMASQTGNTQSDIVANLVRRS